MPPAPRSQSPKGHRFQLPLLLGLVFVSAAMMVPLAAIASAMDAHEIARSFFYAALLVAMVTGLLAIAWQSQPPWQDAASILMATSLAYFFLPLVLAIPFAEALPDTRFLNAYFEMLSCLTTTGASYYDPSRLDPNLHLWRGMVGWLGGFMTWVVAFAILAPLNLGGFEVSSEAQTHTGQAYTIAGLYNIDPHARVMRALWRLAPIYGSLTGILWILLVLAGETPMQAAVHAMSTLSTSGISATEGDLGPTRAEFVILLFFVFALSRRTFLSTSFDATFWSRLIRDREVRLALMAVTLITTLLFLRHWIGALEVDRLGDPRAAVEALWGNVFTSFSFLSTTGFVSADWDSARAWSGLPAPGLVLIGLCLMGGGVATTAGGIKLLRIYALYKHGQREIEKLIHPNSVASAGRLGRRIRQEGAYIAWIFFMLFVLSMAAIMVLLAAAGQDFESAMILAIAGLTTTGPLASVASAVPIDYGALPDSARAVLSVAMVLGRMELLVLLALVNPAFWQR